MSISTPHFRTCEFVEASETGKRSDRVALGKCAWRRHQGKAVTDVRCHQDAAEKPF